MLVARNYPLDCGTPTATFVRQFAKRSRSERFFDLLVSQQDRVVALGITSTESDKDRVLTRQTGAYAVTDFLVRPLPIVSEFQASPTFSATSSDNDVLSMQSQGDGFLATYEGDGTAAIQVRTQSGETQTIALAAAASVGATIDQFSSWATGSLARHIWDQTTSRLEGKTPIAPVDVPQPAALWGAPYTLSYRSSDLVNLFTSWPGNTHVVGTGLAPGHQNPDGPWIRSTNHWLADVDLTCVSGWNSRIGVLRATMVSPEHWVCCKHGWEPSTGDVLRFIGRDAGPGQPEQVSTHTVTATHDLPGQFVDVRVGRISPPLPEYISFAKVLPKNCRDRLPGFDLNAVIPSVKFNQDMQALVAGTIYPRLLTDRGWATTEQFLTGALEPLRQFTNPIRFLDSGNPTFVLIDGEAVLVSVHSTSTGGPFLSAAATEQKFAEPLYDPIYDSINTVMSLLGGGYQLTDADIDEFSTYT
jgi:hypothetical protein